MSRPGGHGGGPRRQSFTQHRVIGGWRPEPRLRHPSSARSRLIEFSVPPLTRRSVLDEVRALWEAKLVATGVIGNPSNEGQP